MSEIVKKRDALLRIFLDACSRYILCEKRSLVGVFYLKFFFFLRLILPLVLDVGSVGVVLLWWKNRCADKRPITMDCR